MFIKKKNQNPNLCSSNKPLNTLKIYLLHAETRKIEFRLGYTSKDSLFKSIKSGSASTFTLNITVSGQPVKHVGEGSAAVTPMCRLLVTHYHTTRGCQAGSGEDFHPSLAGFVAPKTGKLWCFPNPQPLPSCFLCINLTKTLAKRREKRELEQLSWRRRIGANKAPLVPL